MSDTGLDLAALLAELYDDRHPWRRDAACRTADQRLFFPISAAETDALRFCDGCPVRRECLDFAIRNNEDQGVWGGMREGDRVKLRKSRPHRKHEPVNA
jgi:WhiB family redox-sensing transcriptional regulator